MLITKDINVDFLQLTTYDLQQIIDTALAEDVGSGDITSELLIPADAQAEMLFVAREPMIACGTFIPAMVYERLNNIPSPLGGGAGWGHKDTTEFHRAPLLASPLVGEGTAVTAGTAMVKVKGPAQILLTGERVALNLMQRMCGVASLTRVYVDAVSGTRAIILDTRKTMPGLRVLDKYAVRAGGGKNHRMGLYDMVMIKDNHVEIGTRGEGRGIRDLIMDTRKKLASLAPSSSSLVPIVVECDTLEQLKEAITAKPDRILLDNMCIETMRRAVVLAGGTVPLEASGGVSLETVKAIAQTGVDYISVGKLTHSAIACDIGADVVIAKNS